MIPLRVKFMCAVLGVCTLFALGANNTSKKSLPSLRVHWSPAQLVNGSPILFLITSTAPLQSISGRWIDHDVFFSFDPQRNEWFGIAGTSLETHAGHYSLVVNGRTKNDTEISIKQQISIGKGKYRHVAVNVA